MNCTKIKFLLLPLLLVVLTVQVQAQYFGQNKPRYETFDFHVCQSHHFDIHHYLDNPEEVKRLAAASEQWYQMHQAVLADTFEQKNPIIFYNNHPDFQQTNTINGAIGVGTGGVTEGFKNRVVMPLAMSNQQTNHVLGHEMVHAFQYHMMINGDSTSIKSMSNIPLWLVEGLAEYMSIGRVDAHTAMWMRDAVLNDDVPTIKDLSSSKYFPYRYGQAFWSFLAGWKGDDIIEPFFMGVGKYGLDEACTKVLGVGRKNLSELWQSSMKKHFGDLMQDSTENWIGKELISAKNAGKMNIAPVLSPNGRFVIFLSEKSLFSTDLFLADARTGEIIRKVSSRVSDGHIDDYNYIESAGTWSPNSQQFAFVGVKEGQSILIIKEVKTGKTVEEFEIEGVPAFSNPAWSPDKKSIVVSGLVNGQLDLYQVNIKTKKVTQLTNDRYTEMAPNWSIDGTKIAFATDRNNILQGRNHGKWNFNIAILDVVNKTTEQLDFFKGADNLNPVFDSKDNLLFLSNRDGFRNMYKYEVSNGKVLQMSNMLTGISGITAFAPAITVSRSEKRDRILYTHFYKGKYTIYQAKSEDFLNQEVDKNYVNLAAATLPKINPRSLDMVDAQLNDMDNWAGLADTDLSEGEYKPKFKLDYIGGSAGVGVGTSNVIGNSTGMAGGVDLLMGDMLGNNQLFTTLALNGEIQDFGGQMTYINRKKRIGWGANISHVPFLSGRFGYAGREVLELNDDTQVEADHYTLDKQRIFEDKVGLFAQYPFSKTLRAEVGGSFGRYSYRLDREHNYYNAFGQLVFREREKLPAPDGFNLWSVNAALVGDNSFMGLTAPLNGYRYRLGVEKSFGAFDIYSVTADYRKYLYLKPLTLAFRAMHQGRYGKDANNLFPLYLGSPWYIRGYDYNRAGDLLTQNGKSVNQLFGSKIALTNVEVRIPFTGPEQLALIKSKFLLTDLNFFVDGGIAFNNFSDFQQNEPVNFQATPMFSAGASVRINVFGALILEPYYAIPFQKETKGVFGLNIIPGW